ncbi:MAG: hypothetical protein ABMA02_00105 [Saprospiraceae bacterium]
MRHLLFFALLAPFLFPPRLGFAQRGGNFLPAESLDSQSSRLLNAYLHEPDSADARIIALVAESERYLKKQDNLTALNHLLMALILEAYAGGCCTYASYRLNQRLGAVLSDMNPPQALTHLKKAVALSSAFSAGQAAESRFQMMGTVAGLHHLLAEPDSALCWHRNAIGEASSLLKNIAEASALNNLGVHFANCQRYDSAMFYYRLALRTLGPMENNRVLFCSIRDNIAQERERQGDVAYAYGIYRFNDSVFVRHNKWVRVVPNRIRLLTAARKLSRPDFGQELENLGRFVAENRSSVLVRDQLAFYRFAENHYLEAGPVEAARHYDRLYATIKDSLEQRAKEQADLIAAAFLRVQTIRFQRDADVYRLESETAQQALRFTRQMTVVLVLAGVVGTGLLILFVRKRKRELDLAYRLTSAELRAKELEARAMTQALEVQKRDITTVALHNTQVLDNRRQVIERLTEIARQKKNAEESLRAFITELQTQEQVGDRARLVQENIDRANTEFYRTLSARFPALSKSEVELCGYLRVNLSSKDIAALKNVAPASVKMSKNRLRKKLYLGPEADLYAFMHKI